MVDLLRLWYIFTHMASQIEARGLCGLRKKCPALDVPILLRLIPCVKNNSCLHAGKTLVFQHGFSLYTTGAAVGCLFPPDSERVSFLSALVGEKPKNGKIIEVGCGTGATSIALAKAGFSVSASDLDPEMIARAIYSGEAVSRRRNNRCSIPSPESEFSVDDMIGALEKAPPSSGRLILCLGNTLPHLIERDVFSVSFLHRPGLSKRVVLLSFSF